MTFNVIRPLGREFRGRVTRNESIAECEQGHPITEDDIAKGVCPVDQAPLFTEKAKGEDGGPPQ